MEAMDELKRVIDVAEDLPYSRLILHMGGSAKLPTRANATLPSVPWNISSFMPDMSGVTICVENTTSEMGAPAYLRSFVDETRLTGLRFNFDVGHAYLTEGPEEERIANSFEPLKDLIASAHIHDNHGEKDEHLPPYDGTIGWPAALKLLHTTPAAASLPLTLELKEKSGHDAQSISDQLTAAAKSLDRLEEAWTSV